MYYYYTLVAYYRHRQSKRFDEFFHSRKTFQYQLYTLYEQRLFFRANHSTISSERTRQYFIHGSHILY